MRIGADVSSDVSRSQSAAPEITEYRKESPGHQLVCKATKSLYKLALLLSNPWASMAEQDVLVNNAFAIARLQNPGVPLFQKTAVLHKEVSLS